MPSLSSELLLALQFCRWHQRVLLPAHCPAPPFPSCIILTETITNENCEPPGMLQESFGPFGPEVSPECPRKRGVSEGVSDGVSKKRPESVPGVSETLFWHSGDTLGTLFGHSGARGPKGPVRHPVGHSLGHPPFSGTQLSGTLRGHFGPERLL